MQAITLVQQPLLQTMGSSSELNKVVALLQDADGHVRSIKRHLAQASNFAGVLVACGLMTALVWAWLAYKNIQEGDLGYREVSEMENATSMCPVSWVGLPCVGLQCQPLPSSWDSKAPALAAP